MRHFACIVAAAVLVGSCEHAWAEDKTPPPKTIPDGIYAAVRVSANKEDVVPLKQGEVLMIDRHRYLKDGHNEPPVYLVVHAAADVNLDLAGEPKADKDGETVRLVKFVRARESLVVRPRQGQ